MTRITIIVACVFSMHFLNPSTTLSQPYYPSYYQLWLQSVENQSRIQELQRQMSDVRVAIEALQKDLNSLIGLQQRLQESEISNQNTIQTLSDQLSKVREEMTEIRKALNPTTE